MWRNAPVSLVASARERPKREQSPTFGKLSMLTSKPWRKTICQCQVSNSRHCWWRYEPLAATLRAGLHRHPGTTRLPGGAAKWQPHAWCAGAIIFRNWWCLTTNNWTEAHCVPSSANRGCLWMPSPDHEIERRHPGLVQETTADYLHWA